MNIALISEHASPLAALGGVDSGGQNVYVAQLARQLGQMGHQVDVFTRRDDEVSPDIVALGPNVRVVHVRAGPAKFIEKERLLPYMQEFAVRMGAHCAAATRQFHVAHANFFMSGLVAARLREYLGLPFVITFHALGKVRRAHQQEADRFPSSRVQIEEELVQLADRIVAECPQDRDDLIHLYGADEAKIDIVGCGIDTTEMATMGMANAREKLGLSPNEFIVLQLGRLVPRKGIDNVIRAIGHLARDHGIRARLLIVGGNTPEPDPAATPEIGRLIEIARQEGVWEQVQFFGQRPRNELKYYYSAANVFVTTPWYEPFGITPLEAMACGTPVVGASVGGIKSSVVDSVTGYLVPPQHPEALANRLACFYRNPELGRAFGRAGIRHVRSRYTWQKIAQELQPVYKRVIKGPVWASTLGEQVQSEG